MVENMLKELKEFSSFHVKNIALNLGLLEGHSDYAKFIILGKGRSGSNFLKGLLNSHSQVITFGEIFRDPHAIGWDLPPYDRYLQQQSLVSLLNQDPTTFLSKEVFKKYPKHISAVGFKLFYYHAQEVSRQVLWSFLKEKKELKILHLKRRNTLRELLSLRKAFKTNHWTNTTGTADKSFSISLNYDDCLQEFIYAQQSKEQFDTFFQDHPRIGVVYEDLANDYEREMRRIQDFLEVTYEPVIPSTFKQSNQPLIEAISNYSELKQKFEGTPWETFFEE
jgi:LPS sulfotransferase NodH